MSEEDDELRRILERKKAEMFSSVAQGKSEGSNGSGEEGPRVVDLNDNTFDKFLGEHKAVVVDFWAPWCAPCFLVSPIIDDLSTRYTKVAFARVNADESPLVASKYYVLSLPTIMFFLNGEEVDRVVGAVPDYELEERVQWLASRL
ncbi:MAG: thioredoxin [Acidilobus sp.]